MEASFKPGWQQCENHLNLNNRSWRRWHTTCNSKTSNNNVKGHTLMLTLSQELRPNRTNVTFVASL